MQHDWLVWLIIGLAAIGLAVASVMLLSSEARLRRRRRKSPSRIISKTNRPSVKFSVRPPKE
jgi:hypothetical protein